MSHSLTQPASGPLARASARIAAIIAQCNYAQTRIASAANTPQRF